MLESCLRANGSGYWRVLYLATDMRAYGVRAEVCPDIADIKRTGASGHAGSLPGKSGDYHHHLGSREKARIRRYWKRLARKDGKAECRYQEENDNDIVEE